MIEQKAAIAAVEPDARGMSMAATAAQPERFRRRSGPLKCLAQAQHSGEKRQAVTFRRGQMETFRRPGQCAFPVQTPCRIRQCGKMSAANSEMAIENRGFDFTVVIEPVALGFVTPGQPVALAHRRRLAVRRFEPKCVLAVSPVGPEIDLTPGRIDDGSGIMTVDRHPIQRNPVALRVFENDRKLCRGRQRSRRAEGEFERRHQIMSGFHQPLLDRNHRHQFRLRRAVMRQAAIIQR
ncbi:hypothetical protein SDC9_125436 [bioreactor metagenome]|uniref:Uncharacterized protein n=1 Tax=bioreactor metagenome TaxID=1076179 RepID=A0A645CNG1_9ZZZZ